MKELIKTLRDFKIIPNNFKSSGTFELVNTDDSSMTVKLLLIEKDELKDYEPNTNVEIFAVNNVGLIYFETKILERNEDILKLALTEDYSIIQRREYSRVGLKQGNIEFKDIAQIIEKIENISAGGAKLIAKEPLELDKEYAIEITLSNNMKINCDLKPIRIQKTEYKGQDMYMISGKFINLENIDRIVLVQYTFKIKMEEQNKEDE